MSEFKKSIQDMLEPADVRIDGERPWDMKVHNDKLYKRLIRKGSLGLGESYMDRWWDAAAPDQFFYHILKAELNKKGNVTLPIIWTRLKSKIQNLQSEERAYEIGERHYDTGNDLFEAMLDKRMVYTSGFWLGADTLDEAQEKKLDITCQKLKLKAGQRVLDIGCGWGSFAKYAAEKYEAEVVGLTVSRQQKILAQERCKSLPIEIRLQDYRKVNEPFDHIVSLGMFEHVGKKNYRTYMQMVYRCLSDNGVFVLNTIGANNSTGSTDPWIAKYIFPNSMVPSMRQIGLAIEDLLVVEQWDNYGDYYDKTLMAWLQNFNKNWDKLKRNYSERFYRMWKYYLLCSAGSFRARNNHLWQIVLTKR